MQNYWHWKSWANENICKAWLLSWILTSLRFNFILKVRRVMASNLFLKDHLYDKISYHVIGHLRFCFICPEKENTSNFICFSLHNKHETCGPSVWPTFKNEVCMSASKEKLFLFCSVLFFFIFFALLWLRRSSCAMAVKLRNQANGEILIRPKQFVYLHNPLRVMFLWVLCHNEWKIKVFNVIRTYNWPRLKW